MNRIIRNASARSGMLVLMLIVSALLGACSSPVFSADQAQAPNLSDLSENLVRNAQYTLPDVGTFQLKAGNYEQK